jgi:hypothetical protein
MNNQQIKQKVLENIKNKNYSLCYYSPFPHVFRYSDNYSIGSDSLNDLRISFAENCVARNSHRANVGDGILVLSRNGKEEKIYLFCAVITDELREQTCWKDYGGHTWKFNYQIEKVSEIVCLDEIVIESIIGYAIPNWKMFSGLPLNNWSFARKNLKAAEKIFRFVTKHYPIKDSSAIQYNDIADLTNKITIY